MSKILVLGAGASLGNGTVGELRPPQVTDFFKHHLFKTLESDYQPLLKFLKDFHRIEINNKSSQSIEDVFAEIETVWRMDLHKDPRDVKKRFGLEFVWENPLNWLVSYVVDIIVGSTQWLKTSTCPYHDYLVQNWLSKGDSIISLNYDLIIDASLRKSGNWYETTGYGFSVKLLGSQNDKASHYDLFKPHGSLNWTKIPELGSDDDHGIAVNRILECIQGLIAFNQYDDIPKIAPSRSRLLSDLIQNLETDKAIEYEYRFRSNTVNNYPLIILPSPNKSVGDLSYGQLSQVWRNMNYAIEEASEILIIGYSFGDRHFNQILKEANHDGNKVKVTIVNPDNKAIDCGRRHLESNIVSMEVIGCINTLEAFIKML